MCAVLTGLGPLQLEFAIRALVSFVDARIVQLQITLKLFQKYKKYFLVLKQCRSTAPTSAQPPTLFKITKGEHFDLSSNNKHISEA